MAAISPAPWTVEDHAIYAPGARRPAIGYFRSKEDAQHAAHARNALPELRRNLEALRDIISGMQRAARLNGTHDLAYLQPAVDQASAALELAR